MNMVQHFIIKGPNNIASDTFSRLSCTDDVSSALVGMKITADISNLNCYAEFSPLIDDQEMLESFLALPCLSSNNIEAKSSINQKG
jgi:hypothetical protein